MSRFITPEVSAVIVTISLFLHGLAHLIALFSLFNQARRNVGGEHVVVRSLFLPRRSHKQAALSLLPFWVLSTLAFMGASAATRQMIINSAHFPLLTSGGALISTVGIVAARGFWPGSDSGARAALNTGVAMVMNFLILSARVWLQWLPSSWII